MKRFEFADFQTAQTKLCTAVRKANIQCKSSKAKFKRFFFGLTSQQISAFSFSLKKKTLQSRGNFFKRGSYAA